MRRLAALLLSSSALVFPYAAAMADDHVWPQVGGWGQAWSAAANPQTAAVPKALATAPSKGVGTAKSQRSKTTDDDSDRPVKMTADEVSHNQELDIVTARGAVEAFQGRRHLLADTVTYNVGQGIVTATGHVVLVEPTGEITKAEYLELTNDFGAGIAKEIRYLAIDKSRVAARSATRSGGNRTDFDQATYTPCEPCKDDPDKQPLWQAVSRQVTHNQEQKIVEYKDVWLDVAGMPVFYSPYFSAPDPSVKRLSGFLTPSVGDSRNLGPNVILPYFWVLNPQEDITIYPRLMLNQIAKAPNPGSADGGVLSRLNIGLENRWTGYYGAVNNSISFAEDPTTNKFRGRIYGKGQFDLDDNWRAGYLASRMTDDTYNLIYGYPLPSDKPYLVSRVYSEGFWQKDYANIEGFGFQGITPETDAATKAPWTLPHASFTHISSPGAWNDYWTWSTDTLTYMRLSGTSASRVSNKIGWTLPYRDQIGGEWKIATSAQTDAYHSDGNAQYGSTFADRAVPLMSINWSYPFVNNSMTFPQTITPMGMIAASPNAGNPHRLPNEDSIDYEFDDINIFQPNRMTGLDRVEEGVRGAYGLRWMGLTRHGDILAQFAQGWRGHSDSQFNAITGFNGSFSDYLARVTVEPGGNFRITDRMRLDRNSFSTNRNEISAGAGPQALNFGVSYYNFVRGISSSPAAVAGSQQIYYSINSEISRYWSFKGTYQDDLLSRGKPLGWRAQLTYNDECFAIVGSVVRNFTYQNDYLAGITVGVNIVLKSFGQMPFTLFSD